MLPRPVTVSTDLQLQLVMPGAAPLAVRAGLSYQAADPYAVHVAFHTGSGAHADVVDWTFARQLLTDGVAAPVGQGDVRAWPSTGAGQPVVYLSLSSPSGKALFEVPARELVDFLAMTYEAVPTGGESAHVDVDSELALLLWAEPET